MLGCITMQKLEDKYNNKLPVCFNPDLLPKLTSVQIIYFDKMRIEQVGDPLLATKCRFIVLELIE